MLDASTHEGVIFLLNYMLLCLFCSCSHGGAEPGSACTAEQGRTHGKGAAKREKEKFLYKWKMQVYKRKEHLRRDDLLPHNKSNPPLLRNYVKSSDLRPCWLAACRIASI